MDLQAEKARFDRDWEVDFGNLALRRREFGMFRRIKEFFRPTKYPVIAMYLWARGVEVQPAANSYPHIVNSDDLPPIDGIPTRFELNNGWDIPVSDRQYLVFGPLTKGTEILVPPLPEKGFLVTTWEIVKVISTIGGALGFIFLIAQLLLKKP